MASTIELTNSASFASIFTRGNPLANVLGIANEPAITIGNWVRQMILGPPFAWRWNRRQTVFRATIGVQDYGLTQWNPSTIQAQLGRIILDPNGYQQSVTATGTSGASPPTWSTTPGALTTDGSVTWVNQGNLDGNQSYQSLLSFGWLEKAIAVDDNGNAHELTVHLNTGQNTQQNQPFVISAMIDNDGPGTPENQPPATLIRIQPPPEQNYTIYLIYQQSALNFTSLTDTWTPIPDYLSYIYNQGFLARSYEYMSDERYIPATQMFVKFLVAANEGLSESQVNIFLGERMNTARQQQDTLGTAQLARAGRSLG